MFAWMKKTNRNWLAVAIALFAGACEHTDTTITPPTTPAPVVSDKAVVALLVPYGSENKEHELLARNLENGAKLAASQLDGAEIELRVYPTLGRVEGAAEAARLAVSESADIILGPVFADATREVAPIAAQSGLTVVSFSNDAAVAGGNVLVLGDTFENRADRLLTYALSQGRQNALIVSSNNTSEEKASRALERAVVNSGANLVGSITHEFTQMGIMDSLPEIKTTVEATQPDIIFFTSDTAGGLSLFAQLLPESGIDNATVKFAGINRWDIPESTLRLSGLQGGWFPRSDPNLWGMFRHRFEYEYKQIPHPHAALGYDGIVAIGTVAINSRVNSYSTESFVALNELNGATGAFRFLEDGTTERALSVAEVQQFQGITVSPAPRTFEFVGS